ncbi:uncharacterized protein LOC116345747 [Contarinia nasturtii]|uniref:uncharacterized protein LOC116345747 n=1 Tax=Contarinia nasturtii TaxID=265458 RepID=UPI0012D3D62C|nr:uncharacterized protein LOC116345747 [Contarinia nasturtii]
MSGKMLIFLYTIVFAVLLNECTGAGGSCFSSDDDFDIDEFEYEGDPIKIACITDSQPDFYIAEINGTISVALTQELNNGKGLSIFFHAISKVVTSFNGLIRQFANEWSQASGNNICIVTYSYKTIPKNSKSYAIMNEMVRTRRLEYVAKMARDLVYFVREKVRATKGKKGLNSLSKVDVTGFGFGAHIAGRTCEYLLKKTGETVQLLLALDPIKTPLFGWKIKNSIRKGDAKYVQVIHTSKKAGTWDQIGDVDIYVKYEVGQPERQNVLNLNDDHLLAFFIHVAISTKRLYIKADLTENGKGTVLQAGTSFKPPTMKQNELAIGIYGQLKDYQRGKKYGLILTKAVKLAFWGGVANFAKSEILLGSKENGNESPDSDKCIICYENKKNAVLKPCNHQHTCDSCWRSWRSEWRSDERCPVCKQKVTSYMTVYA